MSPTFLTDAQLRAELRRCRSCETKPCRSGCPASCSPADFILAARCGEPSDYRRAAAHILAHNPLGGVCGSVCPDTLCMARCSRRALDGAVNIPAVQAAIVRKARQLGVLPRVEPVPATGQRIAVVGAGPAGLGAASVLAKAGHAVHVFDQAREPGGMARLIPRRRLDPEVLAGDLAWVLGLGDVHLVLGKPVALPRDLLARGFGAVIVAAGLGEPVELDVPGHERAFGWAEVLGPRPPALRGRRVGIVGDGAVAIDCAEVALARGATHVELFARKTLSELGPTREERDRLFTPGVHVSGRVRVTAIRGRGRGTRVTGLALRKVALAAGQPFHPSRLTDLPHGEHERRDIDAVILAIGGRPGLRLEPHPRVFYAGDLESGPTSVVEALASGKKAGLAVHRMLAGDDVAACPDRTACPDGSGCPQRAVCPEWSRLTTPNGAPASARTPVGLPVSLSTDFFGRPLRSPFLLAASPFTGGYAQVKKAYDAGWAGAVLSVASDGVRGRDADDALDEVCRTVERLRREFGDRLTLVSWRPPFGLSLSKPELVRPLALRQARGERCLPSLGGPRTCDGEADARAWQANTRRLEAAGAMGIEYSLCAARAAGVAPESVAAPDAERAERFVHSVLAASDPGVPKLFKVAATAESSPLLAKIAAALARHPRKPAGVTLADSSGALASAVRRGLVVSGDCGATSYLAAARLLALGAKSVQLGTIVLKYGLGVVNDLEGGLSYLLAERGVRSVAELAGSALAEGRDGSAGERVCEVDLALCTACGNCSRCPYLAISLDARGLPTVDASRCTGCGACLPGCFTGALAMRLRDPHRDRGVGPRVAGA